MRTGDELSFYIFGAHQTKQKLVCCCLTMKARALSSVKLSSGIKSITGQNGA